MRTSLGWEGMQDRSHSNVGLFVVLRAGSLSRAFVEADSRAAADPCERAHAPHVRLLDTHLVIPASAEHSMFAVDRVLPPRMDHNPRGYAD